MNRISLVCFYSRGVIACMQSKMPMKSLILSSDLVVETSRGANFNLLEKILKIGLAVCNFL